MVDKPVVTIEDDFDIDKIVSSGQLFRTCPMSDGSTRFITGDSVLYLKQVGLIEYEISCSLSEWREIWVPYFDLKRSYSKLIDDHIGYNDFIDETMQFGRGIRVLKQDAWETLSTFIVSQRRSIPSISTCVNRIAERFGESIDTGREEVFLFPSPEVLVGVPFDELNACGLGYRTEYVAYAARAVASGALDLSEIAALSDADLVQKLMSIKGVGIKVANCVALYAYARYACAPVDVWIDRAIQNDLGGKSPFELYGNIAGIIQQFMFYYKIMHKGNL